MPSKCVELYGKSSEICSENLGLLSVWGCWGKVVKYVVINLGLLSCRVVRESLALKYVVKIWV